MKTHKRMIALFVVFAFLALLQVSAMPLRADQAPGQSGTTVANPDQGPNYIEEEGTGSPSGKKSIVPIILIGLGVAALAAVLVLVVFKTKYDITGTWDVNFSSASPSHTWTWTLTFRGDKKSGTFYDEYGDTGTYTVDGKNVSLDYDDWNITLNGTFDGKDRITGNATFSGLTIGGLSITGASFTATRTSSSTAKPSPMTVQSASGRKERRSSN